MLKSFFFRKWCLLLDNVEKYGRTKQATSDNIKRHVHFACRITKAKDTRLEYVTLIAFPWQHLLGERASVLC